MSPVDLILIAVSIIAVCIIVAQLIQPEVCYVEINGHSLIVRNCGQGEKFIEAVSKLKVFKHN